MYRALLPRERKIKLALKCTAAKARDVCACLDSVEKRELDEEKSLNEKQWRLCMQAAAAEIGTLIGALSFSEQKYGVGARGVQVQILEAVEKYIYNHR